jgi:hypothetical protein
MMNTDNKFSVIPIGTDMQVVEHSYRRAYDYILQRVEDLLGDRHKAELWMCESNPLLGNVSPVSMIAHGRSDRLGSFISECEKISR